jgi:hypothetical protein
MIDIAQLLTHKFPDLAGWEVVNNEITQWPKEVEKPTQKQLTDWWREIEGDLRNKAISQEREARYKAEADGLFFKWQAGEIDKGEWLDARQRIKKELPKT